MKVKLTANTTIAGVDYPKDFELDVSDKAFAFLTSVGGCEVVADAPNSAEDAAPRSRTRAAVSSDDK